MLARLVLRPDRAMVLAALGLAAAILLPVAGALVVAGLDPTIPARHVAYAKAGERLDLAGTSPTLVVAASVDRQHHVAFRVGDPVVDRGQALAMPEADAPDVPRAASTLDGLAPHHVLVHPDDLGPSQDVLAIFLGPAQVPGAIVAPARGADAFEADTAKRLQGQSAVLVVLSIPAVALVAFAFTRQETRARRAQSAVFVALGSRRHAIALVAARALATAAFGAVAATCAGYALYRWGGPVFHPDDAPRLLLGIAILLPAGAAALAGVAAAWLIGRDLDVLRASAGQGEDDLHVALPTQARPLLLGIRPIGILLLCALLFAADVGFPLAAARVPASLGGDEGEWVLGAEDGLVVGRGVPATAAEVAWLDPRVQDSVGETVVPTLLDGSPVVVRGGTWDRLASYHGLGLRGEPPGDAGIVLGLKLADRLGAEPGQAVVVQGGDRPDAMHLTVTGVASGPRLLQDEAFVSRSVGRRLADLPEGQAMLVRVRPDTEGALAALQRQGPELVVTQVRVDPAQAPAGSLVDVVIDVANLGASPGERPLAVRVNGEAVASQVVQVGGHGFATMRVPMLVPAGPFAVDVNPTAHGEASASRWSWEVPASVPVGQPFTVRLLDAGAGAAGVEVGLFRGAAEADEGAAIARAATDQDGRAVLPASAAGSWFVGTFGDDRNFAPVQVTGPGGIEVEAVWTEPAALVVGATNRLVAQVRNRGDAPASAVIPAFVDGLRFAEASVELAPGEATTVSFSLYIIEPAGNVTVGNRTLLLGSQAVDDPLGNLTAPPPDPDARPPQVGGHVQAQVADRALGDARAVLLGLAGSAVASTLAVVVLATRRALAGRRHVLALLAALGWDVARIRQRAAAEGAGLGAVAALAMLLPAKLGFLALGEWGPVVFAHGLPDPIGPLFALQTTAAFAGICALAAYASAGDEAARAVTLR